MANSKFAKLVASKLTDTKSLAAFVPGSARLGSGEHDVIIAAVDTSEAGNDTIKITFANNEGNSISQTVFLLNQDGNSLSITASQLLSSLVVDRNNYVPFLDWAAEDAHAWEVFTGLACTIEIRRANKGYISKVDGVGSFAAYDVANGAKFTLLNAEGNEVSDFATVDELRTACKANNIKPAYENLYSIKAPADSSANAAIVAKALAERA